MFKKIKWPWWNATGTPKYRSRIAQLRAKRQELEPNLNLGLPREMSDEEKEILSKKLPMPTLPSATSQEGNNNQKMIWGIISGIVLLAGIITTVVIIKKRKEGN